MTQFKNKLSKKQRSEFLLLGSIIALFIGISPYIFYLYEIFPDGPVWENSYFIYESKYFQNVATAAWTFLGKFVPLYLLLIWFFTCKHWWYHIILVPVFMYGYQMINAIYEDSTFEQEYIDTGDLWVIAPVVIIVLSIVYVIRIKIFDKVYGIDLSEIEETEFSVFSPYAKKEYEDLKSFRDENEGNIAAEPKEDYYKKL